MPESVYSLTSAALKKPLCWGTCPSLRLKRFTHVCYLTRTHIHPLLCYLLYYAYTHWGFYQAKVFFTGDRPVKKKTTGCSPFKAGFPYFGKSASLDEAAISTWEGSRKFLERRNRLLFNVCHWAWKSAPLLFII